MARVIGVASGLRRPASPAQSAAADPGTAEVQVLPGDVPDLGGAAGPAQAPGGSGQPGQLGLVQAGIGDHDQVDVALPRR